jgi:hypothetical protein
MNMSTTPERRKEIAAELKILRLQIEELGGSHEIGSAAARKSNIISKEEREELRKRGEAKKKEKLAKKKETKNKNNTITEKPKAKVKK